MRSAAALVVLALLATGCVSIQAAHVPGSYLTGASGNGWSQNASASQREPTSSTMGFQKTWTLVYEDRATNGEGYPGVLVVTTLRAVPSPSSDRIREHVETTVRGEASSKGIALGPTSATGTRTLANGHAATWFAYVGNVSSTGFFSRNAEVRIFGEVFECSDEDTIVASVGIAQVSDERSVKPGPTLPGVPAQGGRDDTTWREIVADEAGHVDGIRGTDGLAFRVAC